MSKISINLRTVREREREGDCSSGSKKNYSLFNIHHALFITTNRSQIVGASIARPCFEEMTQNV